MDYRLRHGAERADRFHVLTVDFARGLLALGVCLYHLLSYEGVANIAPLGHYAVYAFFVISGFSIYISYAERLGTARGIQRYIWRRFWRIAPLFYLVIAITLVMGFNTAEPLKLLANVSLLFGFVDPSLSLITGGWSIGVEFVFYIITPLIAAACGSSILRLGALAIASAAGNILIANSTATYMSPWTFLVYYCAGCLLAAVFRRCPQHKGTPVAFIITAAVLAPFVMFADEPNDVITRGGVGALLMTSTIIFIASVAYMPEPTGWLGTIGKLVGELSYSIYLVHPIVYQCVRWLGADPLFTIAFTVMATIVISYYVFLYFEKPAKEYGKGLAMTPQINAAKRLHSSEEQASKGVSE